MYIYVYVKREREREPVFLDNDKDIDRLRYTVVRVPLRSSRPIFASAGTFAIGHKDKGEPLPPFTRV